MPAQVHTHSIEYIMLTPGGRPSCRCLKPYSSTWSRLGEIAVVLHASLATCWRVTHFYLGVTIWCQWGTVVCDIPLLFVLAAAGCKRSVTQKGSDRSPFLSVLYPRITCLAFVPLPQKLPPPPVCLIYWRAVDWSLSDGWQSLSSCDIFLLAVHRQTIQTWPTQKS